MALPFMIGSYDRLETVMTPVSEAYVGDRGVLPQTTNVLT